jgi:hypothetical protein
MPRRTKNQRRADRLRVAEMILRGKTNVFIAETLNISPSVAGEIVKGIEEEWKSQRLEAMDVYKKRELEHLNFLYQEAINGWERSIREKERKRQRIKSQQHTNAAGATTNQPVESQAEVTKEEQAGDPRFLQTAIKIREDIRNLVGIIQVTELKLSSDIPPSPEEARKELAKILAPYGIDGINIRKDAAYGSQPSTPIAEVHHEH